jgi:hypothetical protein
MEENFKLQKMKGEAQAQAISHQEEEISEAGDLALEEEVEEEKLDATLVAR